MIIVDTREKKNAHVLAYFERNHIQYIEKKLDTGDYMVEGQEQLLIDRKQNLAELAVNISPNDNTRFKAELRRLDALGGKMYILVEEKLNSLEDVKNWKNKYGKRNGASLYATLSSYQYKHNIAFVFCHKNSTGRVIAELLGVNQKKVGA